MIPGEIEKRSDFGQFWTDSQATQLWSRQPGEPAEDYQVFVAWLQRPAPRTFGKAAVDLPCSLHRLRRLSVSHRWKFRATAFDNRRAEAASEALDQYLQAEAIDWQQRAGQIRLCSWALHEQMIESAFATMSRQEKHPGKTSLLEIARMIEVASALGRHACGLSLHPPSDKEPEVSKASLQADFTAALQKIYGHVNEDPGPSETKPVS